jgi:hypothetical protein
MDELYGPSYKGMNTVIQAMHHVTTKVNVDARQVYMVGHGMGGHATWNLALHYPTYFAAINPLAGAASGDWQRVRMLNLKNVLPVVWHDSDDKVIPPAQSGALVSILRNLKMDVVFEQTRNVGHVPSGQIMEKCYAAMRARTRDLYPKQVSIRSTRPDPTFNRVDWVQVYQPLEAGAERQMLMRSGTGKIIVNENAFTIEATYNGNKIEAKSANVQTLRFYLNDQMMDLAKPVTIIVNGKTRFEGMVKTSLEEMLNDQMFLERGWRYFTAVVDLDLGVSPASQPTTRATSRPVIATTTATKLFFTIDDGKTWFPADASNKAPFVHDGKQALRAHVFQCADKPPFVGYLSKFSSIANEHMVKKAGETRWFPHSTPNAAGIMTIKCGEGPGAKAATEIFPQ